MPTLPRRLYWLAFHADAHFDRAFRAARARLGIPRPLQIIAYRGWGTSEQACIKCRVQEDRAVPPPGRRGLVGSAVASYKRYATLEIPNARLRITWRDRSWEVSTDDEGFVELWVDPPADVEPGWHRVAIELLAPDDGRHPLPRATAAVLIAPGRAEYAVISDIDDTVIVTGVTNLLKRAYALFLTEHRTRVPFEGVSELYAAFHEGYRGDGRNPIFYVSSSPWNLYEHLDEFMRINDIPPGPILLRDWGLTRTGFAPGGGHGHKLQKIRDVIDSLPHLRFVLVGDSGQEDAEHYHTIVREYGERIRAVYIRVAHRRSRRHDELDAIARDVARLGSEMVVVEDTVAAARHAARAGLIRWEEIGLVDERKREDEEEGGIIEEILGGEG